MSVKNSLRALSKALGSESEAKSVKGILVDISKKLGGTGKGQTVSELVMEIAVAKGYTETTTTPTTKLETRSDDEDNTESE